MRTLFVAALFAIALVNSGFGQHDPERSRQATLLEQQANEAYAEGDLEAFKDKLIEALALEPNRPISKYNLACGYALTNEGPNALKLLIELADDGYDYGALDDPDLQNLHAVPGWEELAAKLEGMYPPVLNATLVNSLERLDLLPEGIAYDPAADAFYLGSMRHGTITRVTAAGEKSLFATVRADFPVCVLGLEIDPKNNRIWAVGTAFPFATGFAEQYRSQTGVFAFDLKTGQQVESKVFPGGHPAFGFNDLTVAANGDIYCTGGPLFKFAAGSSVPEQLLPDSVIPQCNGICLSPDQKTLYVSSRGVVSIDLTTGQWRRLAHDDSISIAGFDGMYFYDNSLVGIQHGRPRWRVSRCYLNDDRTRVDSLRILEQGNPAIATTTTGAIVGDELYFVARGPVPETLPAVPDKTMLPYYGQTQIWRVPLDQRLP